MRTEPAEKLLAYLGKYFQPQIEFFKSESDDVVVRGISIIQAKVKNVLELIDQLGCLFGPDPSLTRRP